MKSDDILLAMNPSGNHAGKLFTYPFRVAYIDTDRANVVHHASYLRWLEIARVEALRNMGLDYRHFEEVEGYGLPVASVEVKYGVPLKFDDICEVRTWLTKVGKARLIFHADIYRGSEQSGWDKTTTSVVSVACVSIAKQKLVSLPERYSAMLGAYAT